MGARTSRNRFSLSRVLVSQLSDAGPLRNGVKRSYQRTALYKTLLALSVLLAVGCAALPKDYPRTASTAFRRRSTTVGRGVAELAAQHPGQSGFAIIGTVGRRSPHACTGRPRGEEPRRPVLPMGTGCHRTASLHGTCYVPATAACACASWSTTSISSDRDANLAAFDAHPNIEVRLFNPFPHAPRSSWAS